MKKQHIFFWLVLALSFISFPENIFSQKVGIGTTTPEARLHLKGEFNISELCVDADTNQTNLNPMIRLRSSAGTDLMWIHTDNSSNVFMGLNAGRVNNLSTGINNSFVGSLSGYSNTTGYGNTAYGNSSLYSNTTGLLNTAVGLESLKSNTTGQANTAMGQRTLNSNTTGSNNTAIGAGSLLYNSIGFQNTALGSGGLLNNTTGTYNTAAGGNAMHDNTSG